MELNIIHNIDAEAIVLEEKNKFLEYVFSMFTQFYGSEKISDMTRVLISNMGKGVLAINREGNISAIRDLTVSQLTLGNTEWMSKLDKKGIYVLDTYKIYSNALTINGTKMQTDDYMGYVCDDEKSRLHPDIKIKFKEIIKPLEKHYKKYVDFGYSILKFIPEHTIKEHQYVYDKKTDLLFCNNFIEDDLRHPIDLYEKHSKKINKERNKLQIEIINNDELCCYYIKIGNEVNKIISTKSAIEHNQIRFIKHINDLAVIDKIVPLEEAESLGLYKTRNEAANNGDANYLIKQKEKELEQQKLDFEAFKLNTNKEIEELKLKNVITTNDHNIKKQNLELDIMVRKFNFDMKKDEFKFDMEKSKAEIDRKYQIDKYEIEMAMIVKKYMSEIMKINFEKEKQNYDLETLERKAEAEHRKNMFDTGNNVLNTTANVIKNILTLMKFV